MLDSEIRTSRSALRIICVISANALRFHMPIEAVSIEVSAYPTFVRLSKMISNVENVYKWYKAVDVT